MRIVLDLSAVRTTGTIVYTEGFLPAFLELLASDDELIIFGPPGLQQLMLPLTRKNARFVANPSAVMVPRRILWQQFVLPGLLSRLKADVLFEPYDVGPWYSKCPMALGVRNPTPVILAERILKLVWHEKLQRYIHMGLVKGSCRKAESVLFPSRYASDRMGELLSVPSAKRRVVHHGLDLEFWDGSAASEAATGPDSNPYILFASKFYRQKRASLLLEAFHAWRQHHDRGDYRLVFCGEDRSTPAAVSMMRRIQELGLEAEVQLLGIVDRPVLRELYRKASICVLPTVLETFGFPYVEAMASKTPLVCADIAIARELCGEAAYYFRADDREALVAALEEACHNTPSRVRKLAEGSRRALNFSWRREAEETLACIRAAAGIEMKAGALA